MRERLLTAAIAVAIFGVVTGGIVGIGLAVTPAEARAEAPRAAAVQKLAGDWTGVYVSADGRDTTNFTLKLHQSGASLAGTIVEPNTFGDRAKALFLTSNLTGAVRGDEVRFVKTYDGSGGVSHAVTYVGRVDATGRHVRGDYEVVGAKGMFEIAR